MSSVENGATRWRIDALHRAIETHRFEKLIIIVRVSPPGSRKSHSAVTSSLLRQDEFVRKLLPADPGIPVQLLKGNGVSAYSADFVTMIEDALKAGNGERTLLVSVATDRVLRSTEQLQRLENSVLQPHHAIMSLLWDCESYIKPTTALHLDTIMEDVDLSQWDNAFHQQIRAPLLHLNLPLVQPIIWACPSLVDISGSIPSIVQRHVVNAQEFISAFDTTKLQGSNCLDIPKELQLQADGSGFSEERLEQWKEYIEEYASNFVRN